MKGLSQSVPCLHIHMWKLLPTHMDYLLSYNNFISTGTSHLSRLFPQGTATPVSLRNSLHPAIEHEKEAKFSLWHHPSGVQVYEKWRYSSTPLYEHKSPTLGPDRFTTRKETHFPLMWGWMDPSNGLDISKHRKHFLSPPGFEPVLVQPLTFRRLMSTIVDVPHL